MTSSDKSSASSPRRAFDVLQKALPNASLGSYEGTYEKGVTELRSLLSTTAQYVRPSHSRKAHPFVQTDFPEIRRDKFTEGVQLSKDDFVEASISRVSPLTSADIEASNALDQDLKIAIDRVCERGNKIKTDRKARMKTLKRIASSLEPLRAALDECKSDGAKQVAAEFNVAWTACIIDAMEWPDIQLPLRYVLGFDVVFDIQDSGVFKQDFQPAEFSREKFTSNNTRAVKQLTKEVAKSAKMNDKESKERRQACWNRTKEEIDEGLVGQPMTASQMDRKYKRGKWRCIGRSAIKQKGKWRCIDNGKRSKHNKASTMYERITCGRADFPVMVAREFAKCGIRRGIAKVRKFAMEHGTNDLRAAYRRVPTSQPNYTLVAVWNEDKNCVSYCDVPGHNFGLKSAVVNFNRFPELATVVARRLLWCVTEHYYDDNDTSEITCADKSGQKCLVELCSNTFFGFAFDPRKDVPMQPANEYLGVISDLSKVAEGTVIMDVSTKRRHGIRELTRTVLREQKLASGLAASLFGKARFMLSPCYGSLGKACLQPIVTREYQPWTTALTQDIRDSVEFIEYLCDELPPIEMPLIPSDLDAVVIFTDAEGKKRSSNSLPTGHLGFVVYHPTLGRRYASAPAPKEWAVLFDRIKKRDTYIGQFELAAAITPFLSLPAEWFKGRPVELWIDNSGAVGALIKGYSGIPDCARIVNTFHFAVAKLGATSLWIDYVPTDSNPADIPSRLHEMDEREKIRELRNLGEQVKMVIPAFADEFGNWLSSIQIAQSVWGPRPSPEA